MDDDIIHRVYGYLLPLEVSERVHHSRPILGATTQANDEGARHARESGRA